MKIWLVTLSAVLVLAAGATGPQLFAKQADALTVGKKGMLRLTSSVKAGDVLLKPGMYHVRHQVEGHDHVFSFRPVTMPAGYREYQMIEGQEVVRLRCAVEPAAKKFRNTKVIFGVNEAGEKFIEQIQVAGERLVHKFQP